MRTISKWFWAILQHISAPSEKEIRERLLALLLVFLIWAPAYAAPTPADLHRQMDADRVVNIRHQIDSIRDGVVENIVFLPGTQLLKSTCFLLKTQYDMSAIQAARKEFLDAGWNCIYEEQPGAYVVFTIWETSK